MSVWRFSARLWKSVNFVVLDLSHEIHPLRNHTLELLHRIPVHYHVFLNQSLNILPRQWCAPSQVVVQICLTMSCSSMDRQLLRSLRTQPPHHCPSAAVTARSRSWRRTSNLSLHVLSRHGVRSSHVVLRCV